MKINNLQIKKFKIYKRSLYGDLININHLLKAFIFAILMTFFFILLSLTTSDIVFLENGYTGGSDDLIYLKNVNDALLLDGPSLPNLIEVLSLHTEHAPAYPFLLYIFSKIAPLGIFLAVFLNFYAVYFIGLILTSILFCREYSYSPWKFILFVPGILFVAFHAYKDIFLLIIVLLAIKAFNDKSFLLGLFLAFLSGYFRPFNWALLLLSYMLFTRLWLTLLLIIPFLVVIFFIFPEFIIEIFFPAIQTAHEVAYRDIESFGSSYQPSGNLFFDYFLGMVRFIFLPVPWSINWENRPLFLSIIEFLQSVIIWTTTILILIKPNFMWRVIRIQGLTFWYCFLQASIYSVLYFGNAQPRYRVYIYVNCFFLIASMITFSRNRMQNIRGAS